MPCQADSIGGSAGKMLLIRFDLFKNLEKAGEMKDEH
jgi:hypothetical protein